MKRNATKEGDWSHYTHKHNYEESDDCVIPFMCLLIMNWFRVVYCDCTSVGHQPEITYIWSWCCISWGHTWSSLCRGWLRCPRWSCLAAVITCDAILVFFEPYTMIRHGWDLAYHCQHMVQNTVRWYYSSTNTRDLLKTTASQYSFWMCINWLAGSKFSFRLIRFHVP